MKLDFKETVAWVIAGVPFDVMHIVGNTVAGLLIFPLSELLKKLENEARELQRREEILKLEIGRVFERVLEDAGVYKRTEGGQNSFLKFIASIR